jgi:hypothetical protein
VRLAMKDSARDFRSRISGGTRSLRETGGMSEAVAREERRMGRAL